MSESSVSESFLRLREGSRSRAGLRDGRGMTDPELSWENLVTDRDWSDIPWFRKTVFSVVLFLLFIPGYLLLIWTGDTYYKKNDVVYRTSNKMKQRMTVVAVFLMVSYLIRSLG